MNKDIEANYIAGKQPVEVSIALIRDTEVQGFRKGLWQSGSLS